MGNEENNQEQGELTLSDLKEQIEQEEEAQDIGARVQLIIFKLGGEEYALEIDQIKEVVLTPGIAQIPQTPPYIKGGKSVV